jgi:PAS domain S-box-containing protein
MEMMEFEEKEALEHSPELEMPYWWEGVRLLDQPMILLTTDAKILGINKAGSDKLGYSQEELEYKSILDITHKDSQVDQVNKYLDIFYSGRPTSSSKMKLIRTYNTTIEVSQKLLMLHDEKTQKKFALVVVQDLIQEKEQDTCLDIKNLVNRIRSVIGMFDMEEFGSTYNREIVAQINTKLNEVVDTVENYQKA